MERVVTGVKALLVVGLALRVHRHGPALDYVGLATASAASFLGVPGPGEPVLIAAAIFAAKHRLDLGSVVLVAWAAATAGGIAGWVIGLKAGRMLLTAPGPLRKQRLNVLARGDALFARYTFLGILLTPSWMAGIHNVRPLKYNVINAVTALVWAAGIGIVAYYAGPPVIDAVADLGTAATVALIAAVAAAVIGELMRRRRRSRRPRAAAGVSSPSGTFAP
jgi:membrane protein DedA with SNARE-associated domain